MLSIAPAPTIFLHTDATDMRKSFTGLCGLIRGVFGDGFVLWYKRLEQGTFEVMSARDGAKRVRIDATQLAMILGGVRLDTARRRKRFSRAS